MDSRFGRKFQDDDTKVNQGVDFEVENYLQYKGKKFSEVFDANTYILMTKAMDGYDAAGELSSLEESLKNVSAQLLIIGFHSDWLYPPERGKEIQIAAINNNIRSSYIVLEGEHGHDSFLFHNDMYSKLIRKFLESS
jgi:homoserine O-acetyltransferase